MRALAEKVLGKLHFNLEQVQDLTPTPMTLSSVMFCTGENPYTHEKVYVARTQEEKRRQKSYFFGRQASGRSGLADRRRSGTESGQAVSPKKSGKSSGKGPARSFGKAPGKGFGKGPGMKKG